MNSRQSLLVGIAMLACSIARASEPVARYALVIGFNSSDDKTSQELRYADDDAIATHRLLMDAGVDSVLLTRLDADSLHLHGELSVDGPPTLAAVRHEVQHHSYNAFQLVLCDGVSIAVLAHDSSGVQVVRVSGPVAVVTSEHRLGELELPQLSAVLAPGQTPAARLERMETILADAGDHDGHRILKLGGAYGTVSSSLLAVPRSGVHKLIWHYAPGAPGEVSCQCRAS